VTGLVVMVRTKSLLLLPKVKENVLFVIIVPPLLVVQSFIASQVENVNELDEVTASGVAVFAFDPPVEVVEEEEDNIV
jgi:hypothetical protein